MEWYNRPIKRYKLLIWGVALIVLITEVATFELGLYIGRNSVKPIKSVKQKIPPERAGKDTQVKNKQPLTTKESNDLTTPNKPDGPQRVIGDFVIGETDGQKAGLEFIPKYIDKVQHIEETQSKPIGSQLAEPEGTMEYTIQIGAFSSYQNAINMLNSLDIDDYTCWVGPRLPSDVSRILYRVFVGKFRTREAGRQAAEILVKRFPSITEYAIKRIKK